MLSGLAKELRPQILMQFPSPDWRVLGPYNLLARFEDFRALKLSKSESFRALKFSRLESFRGLKCFGQIGVFQGPKSLQIGEFQGPIRHISSQNHYFQKQKKFEQAFRDMNNILSLTRFMGHIWQTLKFQGPKTLQSGEFQGPKILQSGQNILGP